MQNRVQVIVGRKGSGKSTLVAEIMASEPRVICIDSMAEYDRLPGGRRMEVLEGTDACLDAIVEADERRSSFRLACRTLDVDENLDLLGVAYHCPGTMIVVEESSLYCSPQSFPREIAQLIRYGRHKQLDLVFVARRPAELHRDLTANADVLVTFQQQEPRDLEYLRAFYGDDVEDLPTLPPYHVRVFGDLSRASSPVLERIATQGRPASWRERLDEARTPDELRELRELDEDVASDEADDDDAGPGPEDEHGIL